ncbi:MAG TPA: prepilin-type N-terminal cleavage/methylation domain-containing protein [Acetobacteraceae bacterium]
MRLASSGVRRGQSRASRHGGTNHPDGFTLIEVLVAFAIAALVLGTLYQISSTSTRAALAATRYSGAVLVAESAIEVFSAPALLTATRMNGRVDNIYTRDVHVWVRSDLLPESDQLPAIVPYEIDVTVSWQDGMRSRSVALSSLRLGPPR